MNLTAKRIVGKVIFVSNFYLRHLIASIVSIAIPVVVVFITYFLLLLIALVTNSGLGGPIALSFWMIFFFIVSTLYTAILLFPSVLIAEISARVFGKWQHVAQVPISTLVLLLIVFVLSFAARNTPNYSEAILLHWANYPLVTFLVLSIPLGLYWWTMKIIQAGISLPIIIYNAFRKLAELFIRTSRQAR
jgi:hypothetical protein